MSNVPEYKLSIRKLDFNTCHCLRLVNLFCLLISPGEPLSMQWLVGFKAVGVPLRAQICVCVCVLLKQEEIAIRNRKGYIGNN